MDRWSLKQGNLPEGSIVQFKQQSLWDEHRNLVLATVFVVGLQSLFVAALLFQRARGGRQAEISLKESEERMTFTAASANVGLWQLDRNTSELWATEHCRAMFGLPGDVPLTRDTFLEAIHPEDRDIAVAAIRKVREAQEAAVTQIRVVLPDGVVRWVSVRARSRPDGGGAPHQFIGIFVDITEQKTAEAEAELQRQEVTHLMRVSVLGELSGAIAHEVNQPLTAILANAQAALYFLEQESPNLAEIRDALQDIVQEDNRAGEVVRRLRGLLKKGEIKVRACRCQRVGQSDDRVASQRDDWPPDRGRYRSCGRSAGDVRGSHPAAAGAAQPGHERDGCNGVDPGRAAAGHDFHPGDAGRNHRGSGEGSRAGPHARAGEPAVRAVLHHQGTRPRSWIDHLLDHCSGAWRQDQPVKRRCRRWCRRGDSRRRRRN